MRNGRLNWTGVVRPLPERLGWPLKWEKPRRIFVCNESDLFHEAVPVRFAAEVFNTMASDRLRCRKKECEHDEEECYQDPGHTYQILTKRAERMLELLRPGGKLEDDVFSYWPGDSPISIAMEYGDWPLLNVWLGVSVEDQKTADERIPLLLQTPAAVRFVSYEPALVPVDFAPWLLANGNSTGDRKGLDWIIAGGESGPNARPCEVRWIRAVRDHCQAAGVPFFFKQWGQWCPESQLSQEIFVQSVHGGVGSKYQADETHHRVGKKAAGRLLDGREWNEFPNVGT